MGKPKKGGGNKSKVEAPSVPKPPKQQRKTGRTTGGYSPEKLAIRAAKRSGVVSSTPKE
jgi:hypothetical protein